MSHPVRILPAVRDDIDDALHFTLHKFGERTYSAYRDLNRAAIEDIAANPDDLRARGIGSAGSRLGDAHWRNGRIAVRSRARGH